MTINPGMSGAPLLFQQQRVHPYNARGGPESRDFSRIIRNEPIDPPCLQFGRMRIADEVSCVLGTWTLDPSASTNSTEAG